MKIVVLIFINLACLYPNDISLNELYKRIVIVKSHYTNKPESWQDTPKGFEGNKIIRVCNLFIDEIMYNKKIDLMILNNYLSSLNILIKDYQTNIDFKIENIKNSNIVFNYFSAS